MSLFSLVARAYLKKIDRWLRAAADDPAAAQERNLEMLIARGQGTWFGKKHSFDSVKSYKDFAAAVPIGDYVSRIELFDRMVAGESDVCWPGRVKYFAQTSGTTAGDKHIPVTDEMNTSNRLAAMAIFAYYARRSPQRIDKLLAGKMLFLGGSTALTQAPGGAMIGDLSGIASRMIRWPITKVYEPGLQIATMDSWEKKVRVIAERLCNRDVRFVTGMPSWVKILFDRICAIRGIDPSGGMSKVWPNFQLFVHGGVNFEPYRAMFREYFSPEHAFDYQEVYPASEGFIAIQSAADDAGMELMVDNGIFYEFVPLDEWGSPSARRLSLGQVELNVPYCIIMTTNAGLWAYEIGDVVRFTSLKPPMIVFAGRNKHFINAFGENIIGEQVSSAVAAACNACGAQVAEFTAAPRYADHHRPVGAHEYIVEFHSSPAGGVEPFAAEIDKQLQSQNNDYRIKRSQAGMTGVEVVAVPHGTFYKWMQQRGKLGGQNKVPVCANDRRFADEIMTIVRKETK